MTEIFIDKGIAGLPARRERPDMRREEYRRPGISPTKGRIEKGSGLTLSKEPAKEGAITPSGNKRERKI